MADTPASAPVPQPPPDLASLALTITEHAPLPMATVEGATHIVRYCNPAFCRLLGKPLDQLVGKPLDELLPAKDACLTLIERVLRTSSPESYIEQDPSKPHPVFWAYTIWPVKEDKGLVGIMIQVTETVEVHGNMVAMNQALILSSVRQHELIEAVENLNEQLHAEMAERKQAEGALRASEQRFRALFDLGPVAIYYADESGVIQNFNCRAAELWGRKPALGETDEKFCGSFKMFRPDGSFMPHEHCPMAEVVSGRIPAVQDAEVFIERPDGSRITVLVNIQPLKNERGKIIGAINCFYDITERKRAEEASARLAAIVNSSDDAIVSKDLNGIITSWNRGAEHLFGYTAQEAIGKPITMLIPPDRMPEESVILERIKRGVPINHFETVRVRKDGSRVEVSLATSPILNAKGDVIGASKIVRDNTERKKAEEELREAGEALKDADRRKDEFLATLAHELRNPLAPIKNLLEISAHANVNASVIKDARMRIQRQMAKMVQLVDDLMDVSRINSGKIILRKSCADLRVVLEDVLEGGRAAIEFCDRNITVNFPEDPVYLNADPVRLGQIVGNLVNNACKYTDPNGTVAITVQRDGDSALIRVADTGIGIAPDMLPHIFEMFTQIDHSLERTRGGLGLGLAIVKRLVELHGGTVQAVSAGLGQGSEFIVRLPLAPAGQPANATPESSESARLNAALKIVVADDNVDSAESMAMLLQLDGHNVRTAFDGMEAIVVAEKFRPDVVLLDVGMPRLNGYDTAREIRKTEWGRETVLIALTGWGLEKNKHEALAAGFNHHLVKPVDIQEIRNLFSCILPASARRLATHT